MSSSQPITSHPNLGPSGSGPPLPEGTALYCPGKIGKYVLRREIGRGGMGVVYEGEDSLLERSVAIKWLRPKDAVGHEQERMALDRLLREARWAARLNHPNAVAVYDAGEHNGGVFIAMELVRGQSAFDLLAQGPFHWKQATRIALEVCQGLAAAHAAGLIHRDIKPANILLVAGAEQTQRSNSTDSTSYQAWAKLSDFGLSRALHQAGPATVEGQVVGTPHFMSPEQIRGEQLDQRADLYSLGATYYTLLTGRVPFERDDVIQVLFAHCSAAAPDLAVIDPSLPAACGVIIRRCLAKEPRDRFSSAEELQLHLQALLAGESGVATRERKKALPRRVADALFLDKSTNKKTHRSQTPIRMVAAVAILFFCVSLFGAYQFLRSPPNLLSQSLEPKAAAKPVRPALPTVGFDVEVPWSSQQDGLWNTDGELEFIQLSPDRKTLAFGTTEGKENTGRLTLYDLDRQAVVGMSVDKRQYASFSCVAFPNERFVLLAKSNRLVAWDRDTDETTTLMELDNGSARSIDVSADGRTLALGVVEWDGGGRVELHDFIVESDGPRIANKRFANREHRQHVKCVAISPNGQFVGSAAEDGKVIVGSTVTGESKHVFSMPAGTVSAELGYTLQFSPDGETIAAGGYRAVVLWELATGARRLLPERHRSSITAVAFSEDGKYIASGATDGIRIWNVQEGWQAGPRLEGHEGNVITGLTFANGHSVLITAGFDRRIRFLNLGRLKRSVNEE